MFPSYRTAVEELLFIDPVLGSLVRAMGEPVIDNGFPTAYVTLDGDRIAFAVNQDFMDSLPVDEAAGVLLHEAYHIKLQHLKEAASPDIYPDNEALVLAQECIVNDNVEISHGLSMPEGVFKGPEVLGMDTSFMSTQSVYELLAKKPEDKNSQDSNNSDEDKGKGSPGKGSGKSKPEKDSEKDSDSESSSADEDSDGNSDAEESSEAGSGKMESCGGIRIPGSSDSGDFDKALADLIGDVAKELGATPQEIVAQIDGSSNGFSNVLGDITEEGRIDPSRMNWIDLLAKINPKVKDHGLRKRDKTDWSRNNRLMVSVYPQVIVPVRKRSRDPKDKKGNATPVFIIALDLSGSIPRSLVTTLQGMLNDIPSQLIKAYPCTWGSTLLPYEPGGRVAGGGTVINLVSSYAQKVAIETGVEPYVLVITDGQFSRNFPRPGKQWFWMGINRGAVGNIRQAHGAPGEEIYLVDDFKI